MPFVYAKQRHDARSGKLGTGDIACHRTKKSFGLISIASFRLSDVNYSFGTPFNDSTKVIGFFGEAAKP